MAFRSLFQSAFPPSFDGSDFADYLISLGAAEVWMPTHVLSGTTIPARGDVARSGIQQGWALQNTASPIVGDPYLAPYSDGLVDYANLFTSDLASNWNGDEVSLLVLLCWDGTSWNDGVARRIAFFSTGTNIFTMNKIAAGTLNFSRIVGAGLQIAKANPNTGAWSAAILTASVANQRLRAYWNGVQEGSTLTGLNAWSGALTTAMLGATTTTPANNAWKGWFGCVAWWKHELDQSAITAIQTRWTTGV